MSSDAVGGRAVPKARVKLSKAMMIQNLEIILKISKEGLIGKVLERLGSQEETPRDLQMWLSDFDKILNPMEQALIRFIFKGFQKMFGSKMCVMDQIIRKTRYSCPNTEKGVKLILRVLNALLTLPFFDSLTTARSLLWYNNRLAKVLSSKDMQDFELIQESEEFKRFVPMSDKTAYNIYCKEKQMYLLALEEKRQQ